MRLLLCSGALAVFCLACGSKGARFDAGTEDADNPFPDDDSGISTGDAIGSDTSMPVDKCHVPPDTMSGNAPMCTMKPQPPNSFNPVIKWKWEDPRKGSGSMGIWTSPLVANLTDDDKNGEVNLCDIPDVIVETIGSGEFSRTGRLYMLRGTDGMLESSFQDTVVDGDANPALADLDGDKVPEIIAVTAQRNLVIFDNKGNVKFTGDPATAAMDTYASCAAIAVYDLDADGKPEIIYGFEVFDNKGKSKWKAPMSGPGFWCPTTTAADLDGDGKLEVIFGNSAYRWNGTMYWSIGGVVGAPVVANLDTDPNPEIFLSRQDGWLILEHDGKIKYGPFQPWDQGVSPNCWDKPAAVHDFDGDGISEISQSSCLHYGVFKPGPSAFQELWSKPVNDTSGIAASTAFDFLGRGIADAVYGDQMSLYVFDGKTGATELQQMRSSATIIEYPVVADVDNDASADILVVSNGFGQQQYPALQVFQDSQKRWMPTRRIWNQHAYHVTNVREDGTIPTVMPKNWQKLNTFRTNSQVEFGGDCAPPPPNPPK